MINSLKFRRHLASFIFYPPGAHLIAKLLIVIFYLSFQFITPSGSQAIGNLPEVAINDTILKVREYTEQNELDRALALLEPFKANPETYPTLYSDYLVILAWMGRSEEAVHLFENMPPEVPRRAYLLRNMGKAYFDLGRYDVSISLYRAALSMDGRDIASLEGLLAALIAMGDLTTAGALLENEVTEELRQSSSIGVLRAKWLFHRGQFILSLNMFDELIATHHEERFLIAKERDDFIAALSRDDQATLLAALRREASLADADEEVQRLEILCLALAQEHQMAVQRIDSADWSFLNAPIDQLYWFAWAFFRVDRHLEAEAGFRAILLNEPDHVLARIGTIYCYAVQEDFDTAWELLESLWKAGTSESRELLFAQAYLLERQGRFWNAVQTYNLMLEESPGNSAVLRLRLRALSYMGATAVALNQAVETYPEDLYLHNLIRHDAAVSRIRWKEYEEAATRLNTLRMDGDGNRKRYGYDAIVALSGAQRHNDAVALYEGLVSDGAALPYWALLATAESYQSAGQLDDALALYNRVLEENPNLYRARLGKFYTLQIMRHWKEAHIVLMALIEDTPENIFFGGRWRPNPERLELEIIRAWFLAHRNRLSASQEAFNALYHQTPANLDVRNGLAHIYLWRGWPRRSLNAFNIIDSINDEYLPAQTGRIVALNQLSQKRLANALAESLLFQHPQNVHVIQARQSLIPQQLYELRTELRFQREDDGSHDFLVQSRLSKPIATSTRLFGYMLRRHSWFEGDAGPTEPAADFKRGGMGIEHRFNADWQVETSAGFNYDNGRDPSVFMSVNYSPTDHWFFTFFGDSLSTTTARRARATGVDASLAGASATWRQSEWRQTGIGYTRTFFSDDNLRDEMTFGYQQNIWAMDNWRMRLFLDYYTVWNSKGDTTPYYNPIHAWSLAMTHMTEQTVWRIDQRAFLQRLYASVGNSFQKGHGNGTIGSLSYEQSHVFSDRHELRVRVGLSRRLYDGKAVDDINADMVYQWRF